MVAGPAPHGGPKPLWYLLEGQHRRAQAVQDDSGVLLTSWHKYGGADEGGLERLSHKKPRELCLFSFEKGRLRGILSTQVVESPSLEILKAWQHGPEQPALAAPALRGAVGLEDLQRSLPTSAILWILKGSEFWRHRNGYVLFPVLTVEPTSTSILSHNKHIRECCEMK